MTGQSILRRAYGLALLLAILSCAVIREGRADTGNTPPTLAGLPSPGDRIRITTPRFGDYHPVGRFLGTLGDTLLLERASHEPPVRILLEPRTRIEVSGRQTRRTSQGLLIGALVGGAGGLLLTELGVLDNMKDDALGPPASRHDDWLDASPVLVGVMLGALGGALLGSLLVHEEWDVLPTPLRGTRAYWGPDTHGALRAGIAIRF